MRWPLYVEQLEYLAAVTRMLNTTDLPDTEHAFYLRVELRSTDDDKVIGHWSDEIAPDCWAYEPTE